MKMCIMLALASLASASPMSAESLLASSAPTAPSAPVGEWRTADGSATVAIRPCGDNLCGFIATTTSPQDPTIGRQIFYDMKPRGDAWSGTIVDIQDGQRYSGHISLVGETTLKVEGCVMGGMFCGGERWARVR